MSQRNIMGVLSILLALTCTTRSSLAQDIAPEHYGELKYRHIGPVGNRVISVVGIPGDDLIYYAGAASGGIWKTEDGGINWEPIFDDKPVHAIGSLAIAPSDPNIVWAGTGETFIRSNVSLGNGVWKSTDAGKNWTYMGLEGTGRIGRVIIHPRNPDIVYAAALGHAYGPQQERGIYRTQDGGENWEQVLFADENTGAGDLIMDPNNPRILFAGMWQIEIKTWKRRSGGPGSAIYVSRDSGDTWKRLEGRGLPKGPVGKIGLCMTLADSDRIYALIEMSDGVPWEGEGTDKGELWRSDDGGRNWKLVSYDRNLAGRSAYYTRCMVAPDDADEAYFLAAPFSRTRDGGPTTERANSSGSGGFAAPGGDHHDGWIDPTDGARMIVSHDGGLSISENRSKSWLRVQLPIAQMYHVSVDRRVPYYVYGNRQDGPSTRGPSNSRTLGGRPLGGITRGMWHSVGGGESGFATPDPVDPDIIWSSASGVGAVGGIMVRYRESNRQHRQVEIWPESTVGWEAAEVKYRFQWTFPVLISPHDHNTVYATSQHLHRTTNGGQSWEVISPDLTTDDPDKQGISGGITPENVGVEYCCVIYAFDESPAQQGVFWAGSSDGLVHVSRDGGANWTNVTSNIPDLPPLGTVRNIDASKWDPGKAYITVDFHEVGQFEPYVYKTGDYGASWTKLTNGIDDFVLSYARNIREDPVRPGLLYLGTENKLYVSFDDGANWQSLQNNLPATPMYWIEVQEHFNDLVIGTYGRGFWILDDITPLQQLTAEVTASEAHLFEPRQAYRFRPITTPMRDASDLTAGKNPSYGASLNYWLREEAEEDVEVKLIIKNQAGETVRSLDGTKEAGINRVWWDLRGERSTEIELRTKPIFADWLELNDEGTRSHPAGRISVLHPPSTYNVTLQVGEDEYTQNLEVVKDPHSAGTKEDIRLQTEMLLELRENMNAVAGSINQLEWVRRQLGDMQEVATALRVDTEAMVESAEELAGTFVTLEGKMLQLRATGTGQDFARWPAMLVGKLSYLANAVSTADFRPTDQHHEVHEKLKENLLEYQQELEGLLENELPAFNHTLDENGLPRIVTGEETSP